MRIIKTILILLILSIVISYGFRNSSHYCEICLAQNHILSFYGIPIDNFSHRDHDEWGTHARYKAACGNHDHNFKTIGSDSLMYLLLFPPSPTKVDLPALAKSYEPKC